MKLIEILKVAIAAIWAQALGNNTAEADKTLAVLDKDAAESPNDLNVQSAAWWGHGVLALVKGDAKAAAEEMQKCVPTFDLCHFHQAIAQEKAQRCRRRRRTSSAPV